MIVYHIRPKAVRAYVAVSIARFHRYHQDPVHRQKDERWGEYELPEELFPIGVTEVLEKYPGVLV